MSYSEKTCILTKTVLHRLMYSYKVWTKFGWSAAIL